jgi:hypothetical protein
MIRRLAKLLRKDGPSEWPGLRDRFGEQPSRIGANIFVLGCAVDGGQQTADVAWRAAQRFVLGVVPPKEREHVWDWIVRQHTLTEWRRRRAAYGLHRNRIWHTRVYRFADFIAKYVGGDPRNIWRRVPEGVEPMDHVRSVLQTMRFGPALSRMLVGALLDHGLLKGETAFKDDIYVRRGMRRLGLASSESNLAVLEAGRRFFGKNSWAVDLVLYRLGEQGYRTRRQIERYYRQRVLEKRDERVQQLWKKRRRAWLSIVRRALAEATAKLQAAGWSSISNHGKDFLGFLVSTKRGALGSEFRNESLYVWSGVALNVPETCIEVWNQVEFDIDGPVARSLKLRDRLRAEGYNCSYNDAGGWEIHYKLMRNCSISKRPKNLSRGLAGALVRGTEKAVRMLEGVTR